MNHLISKYIRGKVNIYKKIFNIKYKISHTNNDKKFSKIFKISQIFKRKKFEHIKNQISNISKTIVYRKHAKV